MPATDTTDTVSYDTPDGTVRIHANQVVVIDATALPDYAGHRGPWVVVGFDGDDLRVNTLDFDYDPALTIDADDITDGHVEPQTTSQNMPIWGY